MIGMTQSFNSEMHADSHFATMQLPASRAIPIASLDFNVAGAA